MLSRALAALLIALALAGCAAGAPPPRPQPTAERLAEPEPGAVQEPQLLMQEPGGRGAYEVCTADSLIILARQETADGAFVRVRVTRPGAAESCTGILPQAPASTEGWLHDEEVLAP